MIARRVGSLLIVLAAELLAPAVAEAATNGRIVFSSSRDTDFGSELYSIASDGKGATRLTWNSVTEQYPVWSPDGSHIAFQRFGDNDAGRPSIRDERARHGRATPDARRVNTDDNRDQLRRLKLVRLLHHTAQAPVTKARAGAKADPLVPP